jgi:NADH:ubiquinone oxidoreductase subunit 4 (subunit M)
VSVDGIGLILCLTLVAASLARTFYQVMLGEGRASRGAIADLNGREFVVVLVLFLVSLGIGLTPRPLLKRVETTAMYAAAKSNFGIEEDDGPGKTGSKEKRPE